MDQTITINALLKEIRISSVFLAMKQLPKRMIDIVVSALGLLFLLPVFLLVAIMIKRDSPGPVFFWCQRMGRHRRPFRMLKFRTMYELPSSYQGPPVTCDGDKRITPIGQWLRDTKINELPQLWNVLIGEMSLVGPRPEDVSIAGEWSENAQAEILSIRPGITSPASILYHNEEHLLAQSNVMGDYFKNILPDKMRLDQLYVRNQSVTADLDIIFWTMTIIFPGIARTKIPEGLLFFGPISRLVHRYINWFLIDLMISLIVVSIIGFFWRLQTPLNWGFNQLAAFAVILALIFSGVNSLTGLKQILWAWATAYDGLRLALSGSIVTLFLLVTNYLQSTFNLFGLPPLPIVMILSIGAITTIGFLAARYRLRLFTSIASRWLSWRRYSAGVGERVLIVGLEEGFNTAAWLLRRDEFRYVFSIVGVVDDNFPSSIGMWVNDCKLLGNTQDIPYLVRKHDIGVIIITNTELASEAKQIISNLCQNCKIRIAFINQMTDILNQQISHPVAVPDHILWSQDHIKYFALYDAVTGLPNCFLFREQLHRSLAYSRRYETRPIVVFIMLDDLTKKCEVLGQNARSELLKQVSKRLLQNKRESDTLAYLENDEYGLILENIPDDSMVDKITERVRNLITGPYLIDNKQVIINPTIIVSTNLSDCDQLQRMRGEEFELKFNQRKSALLADAD